MDKFRKRQSEEDKKKSKEIHRESMDRFRKSQSEEDKKKSKDIQRKSMDNFRKSQSEEDKNLRKEKDRKLKSINRLNSLLSDPISLHTSEAQRKSKSRLQSIDTAEGRRQLFFRSVKFGPIFICISCHRRLYENSVKALRDIDKFINELEEIHPGIFNKTIGYESLAFKVLNHHHLCLTCEKYIFKGELPPMSNKNKLQIFNENHPKYLSEYEYLKNLSELENCMIAQNILFMKMFALPKSRMSAFKDRLVNIPIDINDISNTLKSLPRTPSEAGIVFYKI